MGQIRFTKDVDAGDGRTFKAGDVVDFYDVYGEDAPAEMTDEETAEFQKNRRLRADASANHWLNRKAAEKVEDDADAESGKRARRAATAPKAHNAPADDYDGKTVEELHQLATDREIEGRSGLDKAGLIKALRKSDKAK